MRSTAEADNLNKNVDNTNTHKYSRWVRGDPLDRKYYWGSLSNEAKTQVWGLAITPERVFIWNICSVADKQLIRGQLSAEQMDNLEKVIVPAARRAAEKSAHNAEFSLELVALYLLVIAAVGYFYSYWY